MSYPQNTKTLVYIFSLVVTGLWSEVYSTNAQVNVTQFHNHDSRDGLYIDSAFTQGAAANLARDLNFDGTISGLVYAQPLYIDNGPGGRPTIIAVTESNNVYALDAVDGSVIWQRNVGDPVLQDDLTCPGPIDQYGITGTPIVDLASRALFFNAMITPDGGITKKHLIFSLNTDTGDINPGWPVDVGEVAMFNGMTFTPSQQAQRPALGIVDNILYVPYGGLFDCRPYHGWLVGVPINNPAGAMAWATSAIGGGVWGVGGVASDGTNPFITTGNTFNTGGNWMGGEAVIRFQPGPIFTGSPADYWAPLDWLILDNNDKDLGSSGPLLVDVPGATPSALVVAFGKDGNGYLLDRNYFGGISDPVASSHLSDFTITQAAATYRTNQGTYVALRASRSMLSAFRITATNPPAIVSGWSVTRNGCASPFVTSTDGRTNTIVWVVGTQGDQRLHGYDGDTGAVVYAGGGANELMAGTHSYPTTGIAARGRIYVATDNKVYAFTPRFAAVILATEPANLKGYWKCDETSGTTLADSSGNSKNLTITGAINTNYWLGETGEQGTCFRTDGVAGYASRNDAVIPSLDNTNFTLFALFKGGTDFGVRGALAISNSTTTNDRAQIGQNKPTSQAIAQARGNSTVMASGFSGGTAFDGSWHSVAFRRNGTAFNLFVDGTSVASTTATLATGSTCNRTTLMHHLYSGTSGYAKGSIQHAAIWNTALSDSEIMAIQTARTLVSNLVVASGRAYQWFDLASGQNMYIDRTYRFGSPIPASINGQFTLRTANDDKFSSANATHVSFTVNQASTVYVLYTTVSTTLESTWLTDANGWSLEDYTVPTTLLGAQAARKVRKKTFAVGATVTLRGNGSTNYISTMYNVVVVPADGGGGRSYSTNFPLTENPISEGGNWVAGQSAGNNLWGDIRTNGTIAFGVSEPTLYGDPTAILTGPWGPNQTAQAVVKLNQVPTGPCCKEAEVRLRTTINPVDHTITGYEIHCSVIPNIGACHIVTWGGPNGSFRSIASHDIYLHEGDVLKAVVTGTNPATITAYINDVEVMSAQDSGQAGWGPWTTGSPGIGFYNTSQNNWSDFGFSSFSAHD